MAVVAPKQRVAAPATRPLNGGLFSQFAPIESDDHQWQNGVTWEDVAAADITRQTLDARTGNWQRRENEQ